MSSASFNRLARLAASTKRPPAIAGGRRAAPGVHLADLRVLPLEPVDAELRERLALGSAHELLQTVPAAADVAEGDLLVVAGAESPIRAVADWSWTADDAGYKVLILEQVKR